MIMSEVGEYILLDCRPVCWIIDWRLVTAIVEHPMELVRHPALMKHAVQGSSIVDQRKVVVW